VWESPLVASPDGGIVMADGRLIVMTGVATLSFAVIGP
jgi:hypothetical protein